MKILIFTNFDVGLYKFRKELISAFIESGNDVTVCLPDGDLVPQIIDLGCKYVATPELVRRGENPLRDLKLLRHYERIIGSENPDYVITYTVKPNIYGGIASKRNHIPYSLNITGLGTAFEKPGIICHIVKKLYSFSNKKAEKIFFENVENAAVMKSNGLVREEQIVVNNGAGVNTEEYAFEKYPSDDGVTRFLFMGRVMREKGVDELFRAAKKLRKEYGENVEIHIVGSFEEDYSDEIVDLSKNKIIIFHGFQADVKPFIRECSCFVLPSYHEGMANTLLESGSMGRPLITSDIHGCKEAVSDNVTGFLVNVKDGSDLYNKMKMFCKLSYEDKSEMGRASGRLIKCHFDKKDVIEKTICELNFGDYNGNK